MSSAVWIFVGLLIISPFYEAASNAEKSSLKQDRPRRSIMNLKSMVKEVTGKEGYDFVGYGNWCGLSGSGRPVDPIDECCQIHDLCYDLAKDGVCRSYGEKAVYQIEYKWKTTDDGTAACEEEEDKCKSSICMCDAVIANCLKNNIESYNDENLHKLDLLELWKEADWLTSS